MLGTHMQYNYNFKSKGIKVVFFLAIGQGKQENGVMHGWGFL